MNKLGFGRLGLQGLERLLRMSNNQPRVITITLFLAISALANPAVPAEDTKTKGKHAAKQNTATTNTAKEVADAGQLTKSSDSKPARKEVLDTTNMAGMAMIGYASAKACPEVVEKLFCYCGCDETDKHSSLLDCFTSTHGLDCHICQEEAVLALKLHKDGVSIPDIQKAIDDKYRQDYPFAEETATYKRYKATHYLSGGSSDVKFGTEIAGPELSEGATHKLKPGKKVGKCCAAGEHDKAKDKSSKKCD